MDIDNIHLRQNLVYKGSNATATTQNLSRTLRVDINKIDGSYIVRL